MQDPRTDTALSRREREKQTRKSEMAAAARAVFARHGFAQATLEDVAELSEFGKGTLYNYFPNKEALFISLLEEDCDRFIRIFKSCLTGDAPVEEKIERLVRESLRFMLSNPASMLLMLRESHQLRENNPVIRLFPELTRFLAEALDQAQKEGVAREDLATEELAVLLMNMVTGQFMSRIHRSFHSWCNAAPENQETVKSEVNELEMFSALLSEDDIQSEIENAAALICSVYFNGISRNGGMAASRK